MGFKSKCNLTISTNWTIVYVLKEQLSEYRQVGAVAVVLSGKMIYVDPKSIVTVEETCR